MKLVDNMDSVWGDRKCCSLIHWKHEEIMLQDCFFIILLGFINMLQDCFLGLFIPRFTFFIWS